VSAPRPSAGTTAGALIAFLLIAAYVFVSLTIILPTQTPVRDAVSRAATPLFSQRWSMFAPHPLREIAQLEIRAEWRGADGKLTSSEWLDVSQVERRGVTGDPLPSRVQESTWNTMSIAYLSAYYALNQKQREYTAQPWFVQGDDKVYRPTPDARLVSELGALGTERAAVDFIRADYMMMRFSTLFATAYFEQDVERIQWRIRYLKPNDFAHRFDDDQQFADRVVDFGLRPSQLSIDPSVVADFRAVIDARGGSR
jgi:hypothetical protein